MNDLSIWQNSQRRPFVIVGATIVLGLSLVMLMATIARASATAGTPLSVAGYRDFSYEETTGIIPTDLTGEKPESKLWWNDGFWWGSLYNRDANAYHIYRLDWGVQGWEDTGVALDDRPDSRADVLWDGDTQTLYVVSHIYASNSSQVNDSPNWGRFYRYSYDAATQTYSLNSGFPQTVNEDKTETLVIDKDSKGNLWVTYVSRPQNGDYQVYANVSTDNGETWGTPFTIPVSSTAVEVAKDDISTLVAYEQGGTGYIGVMWSNQAVTSNTLNLAFHDDDDSSQSNWTLLSMSTTSTDTVVIPGGPDDHISIKSLQAADEGVFAAIKTSSITNTEPLIGVVAFDPSSGDLSFHEYSTKADNDTRPILLIDDENDKLYVFVTGKPGGSKICYKTLDIQSPLSSMGDFPAGNCGTDFISDENGGIDNINNATSTKQNVNDTTGIVVLASDDDNGHFYVHNTAGDPPPVVTQRSPDINAVDVAVDGVVAATFSKNMNSGTINSSSFVVLEGATPVAGTVSYDSNTRTAVFTPTTPLKANATFTVQLSNDIKDSSGQRLYGSGSVREEWSFTTAVPTIQFSADKYSVNEDAGTATITVTLNVESTSDVMVDYATSDGTATSPADYTAISTTLTIPAGSTFGTFNVTIIDDVVEEFDEDLNLTLSNPSGATLGTDTTSTLNIIDNEGAPTVRFSNTAYSVDEAGGPATIEVTLSHPSVTNPITVTYGTSDGTAVAGDDYTPIISDTLTFNMGETSKTFDVTIIDDSLAELDQTVDLTLSDPVNASLGTPSAAVLTIIDDDPTPTVSFSSDQYSVDEGAGVATITVELSAPFEETVTVDYTTADGTAVAGEDYTAISDGQLTFVPNATSQTFNVTIIDDILDEAVENFQVVLSNPTHVALGTPDSAMVSIVDNDDPPTVQFSSDSFIVDEDDGKAIITVELSTASGQSVTVNYSTADGTAVAGHDYLAIDNETLVFARGETSKTFEVSLFPDPEIEAQETVLLFLSEPDDATLGTPFTATLFINDGFLIYLPVIQRN